MNDKAAANGDALCFICEKPFERGAADAALETIVTANGHLGRCRVRPYVHRACHVPAQVPQSAPAAGQPAASTGLDLGDLLADQLNAPKLEVAPKLESKPEPNTQAKLDAERAEIDALRRRLDRPLLG